MGSELTASTACTLSRPSEPSLGVEAAMEEMGLVPIARQLIRAKLLVMSALHRSWQRPGDEDSGWRASVSEGVSGRPCELEVVCVCAARMWLCVKGWECGYALTGS